MQKLVEKLASDPTSLAAVRAEFDDFVAPYFHDNIFHQDYLLTRPG